MAFHFERKVRYRTSPFQKDLRGRGKNHRPSPSAGGGGRPIRNLGERASKHIHAALGFLQERRGLVDAFSGSGYRCEH